MKRTKIMMWKMSGRKIAPLGVIALSMAVLNFAQVTAFAQETLTRSCTDKQCRNGCVGHQPTRIPAAGPLGYGPLGVHPGFQGFGLGYHLGYGYGGNALGTSNGGYPFYGGPGYPHPAPRLNRLFGITPFPHFAGPGYPSPEHPQYFGFTGPLIVDQPVIATRETRNDPRIASSYGSYTGAYDHPDSRFAPFTSEASGVKLEMNPSGASPIVEPNPGTDSTSSPSRNPNP